MTLLYTGSTFSTEVEKFKPGCRYLNRVGIFKLGWRHVNRGDSRVLIPSEIYYFYSTYIYIYDFIFYIYIYIYIYERNNI